MKSDKTDDLKFLTIRILKELGNFSWFFFSSADFSKLTFSKHSFANTFGVSNVLGPDQGRHSIVPDLGPNCLQKLRAEDKSHHYQEKS